MLSRFCARVLCGLFLISAARLGATPVITNEPVNLVVTAGQPATFTLAAMDTLAPAYQWFHNGFPIAGANTTNYASPIIDGLNSASYITPIVSRSDAGDYSVVVSDSGGSVASTSARLWVEPVAFPTLVGPDPAWKIQAESAGGTVDAILPLPDGSFYVAGTFSNVAGLHATGLFHVKANGTVDSGFSPPEISGNVTALAVQSDGKVLVGGDFQEVNSSSANAYLVRLTSTGGIDSAFAPAPDNAVDALQLQPNGQILVGGLFSVLAGSSRAGIGRLNADGTIDSSFDPGAGCDDEVLAITLQPDGKVLIGGFFTSVDQIKSSRIARLTIAGAVDPSFNVGAGTDGPVQAIAVDGNGNVLIGGLFASFNKISANNLVRVTAAGARDSAFVTGSGFNGAVGTVAIQSGKILAGGSFSSYNLTPCATAVRLTMTGALDGTFQPPALNGAVQAWSTQADGHYLLGGNFVTAGTALRIGFARLASGNGALDAATSFALRSSGASVSAAVPLAGGGALIAGSFDHLMNAPVPSGLARLNSDGTLDASFNFGGAGANNTILSVALLPDGRAAIAGLFTQYNGAACNRIAVIKTDGTLDSSFAGGLNNTVNTVLLLPDGKIFAGGNFTAANGTPMNGVAVFALANGSLDANFVPGSGATAVSAALAQADGDIVIAGPFETYDGAARIGLARINRNKAGLPDGSLDTTFDPGSGITGPITSLGLTINGQLLVGGYFSACNGAPRSNLARLNADGSLDPAFVPAVNGGVENLLVQEDGKTLVRGSFAASASTPAVSLVRLNSDGTVDPTLVVAGIPGVFSVPSALAMRDNGQLFLSDPEEGLAATQAGAAPIITAGPPASTMISSGAGVNFSVTASSVVPVSYQWFFNGVKIPGASAASYAIGSAHAANAGIYSVTVASPFGSTTSAAAVLMIDGQTFPPVITAQPQSESITAGVAAKFAVTASGNPAPTYQWSCNGVALPGATGAVLTIANPQLADTGSYTVTVANVAGAVVSTAATLTVVPVGTSANHSVVGSGYAAGGTVTITNTVMYTGTMTALGWQVTLPAGWSLASTGGSSPPNVSSPPGTASLLEWAWTSPPASPVSFTYTVNVPVGQTGVQHLDALVIVRPNGQAVQFLAQPDPLPINPAVFHTADENHDGSISLSELTRVIALYNTSHGATRTGAYTVSPGTEDGFAPDSSRAAGVTATLSAYHSADENRNGAISLTELTRIIALYNYRSGPNRTGRYHVQAGTEDGFAPGP